MSISTPTKQFVTVVFMDLVGSTALAQRMTLEQYGEVMSEVLQVGYLRVALFGGRVLQHQGDALVCLFDGNKVESALRLAQECHKRIHEIGAAQRIGAHLQLRIGIATGEVLSLNAGVTLAVYGLPVNMSRRLCSRAEPDMTLVCERTYQGSPPEAVFSEFDGESLKDFASENVYVFHWV